VGVSGYHGRKIGGEEGFRDNGEERLGGGVGEQLHADAGVGEAGGEGLFGEVGGGSGGEDAGDQGVSFRVDLELSRCGGVRTNGGVVFERVAVRDRAWVAVCSLVACSLPGSNRAALFLPFRSKSSKLRNSSTLCSHMCVSRRFARSFSPKKRGSTLAFMLILWWHVVVPGCRLCGRSEERIARRVRAREWASLSWRQ